MEALRRRDYLIKCKMVLKKHIKLSKFKGNNGRKRIKKVLSLNEETIKVLKLLGEKY